MIDFSYDYMGRRVRKTVSTYNGSSQWVEDTDGDLVFVYEGWNPVLVLDANDSYATLRKYTWGLDLAGLGGDASPSGIHGAVTGRVKIGHFWVG